MPADQCKDDANRIAVNSDHSGSVRVICDGVHVVVMDDSAEPITAGDQPQADVVVPLDWKSADAPAATVAWKPRLVVITADMSSDREAIEAFKKAIGGNDSVSVQVGNTIAVSASDQQVEKPNVVVLSSSPWKMNAELEQEFNAMEAACSESQEVFAKLSTNQMNFKPSNGTHTPRWNTEHMMGRQLSSFLKSTTKLIRRFR